MAKFSLEMGLAQSGFLCKDGEGEPLFRVRFDEAAKPGDVPGGRLVRPAPQTGPQPIALSFGGRDVDPRVFAPRPARRTGRPAVNSRSEHSIDELAIVASIALQNGLPSRVFLAIPGLHIASVSHFYTARTPLFVVRVFCRPPGPA